MADVRSYIRINPLDLDNNKAIGVSIPFDGPAVFNSTFSTKDQLKSNLLNILLTEPGERVFNPNFGVGLRTYLFENFTDIESLQSRIRNQIQRYAPQTDLVDVRINKDNNNHQLNVSIFYRVLADNTVDALQVNFSPDSSVTTGGGTTPSSPSVGSVSSGGSGGY